MELEYGDRLESNIHLPRSLLHIPLLGKSMREFCLAVSDGIKILLTQVKLDPYHAAESSPFNIHREPPRPNVKITRNLGTNAGAAPAREKRFGTINDITGGN